MNARIKQQGGWAGSFVVVGVVLALLLLGGVYFLKSSQLHDAMNDDSATSQIPPQSDDEGKPAVDKTEENKESQPAKEEHADVASPAESTDENAAPEQSAADLPQTGPADTFVALMVFSALTYSIVAYIHSRRRLTL